MKIRARRQNLQVQVLDNETLVYDPEGGGACHVLNSAAATVWKLCDGRSTIDSLCDALAVETGLPKDPQIIEMAIADLRKANLVTVAFEPSEAQLPPHGVERRGLIGRLGLGVGAAVLLPVVDSMLAPLGLGVGGEARAADTTQRATRGYCEVAATQAATTSAATTAFAGATTLAATTAFAGATTQAPATTAFAGATTQAPATTAFAGATTQAPATTAPAGATTQAPATTAFAGATTQAPATTAPAAATTQAPATTSPAGATTQAPATHRPSQPA